MHVNGEAAVSDVEAICAGLRNLFAREIRGLAAKLDAVGIGIEKSATMPDSLSDELCDRFTRARDELLAVEARAEDYLTRAERELRLIVSIMGANQRSLMLAKEIEILKEKQTH